MNKQDLKQCALVCRSFAEHTQPFLWHSCYVKTRSKLNALQTISCFMSIKQLNVTFCLNCLTIEAVTAFTRKCRLQKLALHFFNYNSENADQKALILIETLTNLRELEIRDSEGRWASAAFQALHAKKIKLSMLNVFIQESYHGNFDKIPADNLTELLVKRGTRYGRSCFVDDVCNIIRKARKLQCITLSSYQYSSQEFISFFQAFPNELVKLCFNGNFKETTNVPLVVASLNSYVKILEFHNFYLHNIPSSFKIIIRKLLANGLEKVILKKPSYQDAKPLYATGIEIYRML